MATITPRGRSFYIMVSLGYDRNNRQIRRTMSWTPEPGMTERQIEKAVNEAAVLFENKVKTGQVLNSKETFSDFADRWMRDYGKTQLAPRTYERYSGLLKRIEPAIGHIRMDRLQPGHLMELYANLSEAGVRRSGTFVATKALVNKYNAMYPVKSAFAKEFNMATTTVRAIMNGDPVSPQTAEKMAKAMEMPRSKAFLVKEGPATLSNKTIAHHHRLISAILNAAVMWQVIPSNPAQRVKAPKVARTEAKFLDEKEAARLLECLETEPFKYQVMIKLFLYSGVRRGELCGLEWVDVDFEKKVLSISRSSQYLPGKGVFTKETKTLSSDRTIKLPDSVFDMLKAYRAWQNTERLKLGERWQECNRLFTTWDGQALHPSTCTEWFAGFVARHDLPPVSIHSLRHTNITLMIMAGVPLRIVSRRAGHSNTTTTSTIYSHAIQSMDEVASEALEDILKPKMSGAR
jgi:integrase